MGARRGWPTRGLRISVSLRADGFTCTHRPRGTHREDAIPGSRAPGDRLAVLRGGRGVEGAGRLRNVPGAEVPEAQLGAQPAETRPDRRAALDPRPPGPLRPGAEAGGRGFQGSDSGHGGVGRSGRVGVAGLGPYSGGRRRLQEEAAQEGRPEGEIPRQTAVHTPGRRTHAEAAQSRAVRKARRDPRRYFCRVSRRGPHSRLGDRRVEHPRRRANPSAGFLRRPGPVG